MLRIRRTLKEMRDEAHFTLSEHTDLRFSSPASAAYVYFDALFKELSRAYNVVDYTLNNLMLTKSTGGFLDLLAVNFYGLQREGAISAAVLSSDRNIKFYVESSTLAGILGKNYIPAGTNISSEDGSVIFVVSEDTPIPSGATEVYVSAYSVVSGAQGNAKAGTLTKHNLGNSSVYVKNMKDINSGSDIESDDMFRARVTAWPVAARAGNILSLQAELSKLPGISDVIINPGAAGTGTVGITLIPKGNRLDHHTLVLATATAMSVVSAGVHVFIEEPTYVPLKISIRLIFKPGTTATDINNIKTSVRDGIKSYIESISVGGELVVNAIKAKAFEHSQVKDVKFFCLKINGELRRIVNYQLGTGEIFVLEDEQADPIEVL